MAHRISTKKIQFFQEEILKWYANFNRKYHWRAPNLSTYEYIIAEVLLQRTKADTISRFYSQFIKDFPNWKALDDAKVVDIEKYLMPVGLYRQKAQRLKTLAAEMVKRNGEIPTDRAELELIPFFGQYIANAIEMIIYEKPTPLIDVNMARVLERFFGPRELADIRYDPYLQLLSRKVIKHHQFKEINWAILDFAALICKARNPQHSSCPLKSFCSFYKKIVL